MLSQPFVILFQERSGSTWLASLLNSHDEIFCRYEDFATHGTYHDLRRLMTMPGQFVDNPTNKQVLAHALKLFDRPAKLSGFKLKYPSQYSAYPELLMLMLKNRHQLKVLHLDRKNVARRILSGLHLKELQKSAKLKNGNLTEADTHARFKVDIPHFLDLLVYENHRRTELTCIASQFPHCLAIEYDDLHRRAQETLHGIAEFLGVEDLGKTSSEFRKATPDDLGELVENLDELQQALAATPWSLEPAARLAA